MEYASRSLWLVEGTRGRAAMQRSMPMRSGSNTARAACVTAWIALRTWPNHLCPCWHQRIRNTLYTGSSWGCSLKFICSHRGSKSVTGAQWPRTAEISAELQIFSSEGYRITSALSIFTFKALHTCALTPT